jgi:hypothetical protein
MTSTASVRVTVVGTVLLATAALATSWAGFQASMWVSEQARHGTQASKLRTNSTLASMRAVQHRLIDVELFTSWLAAYAREDARLATFYEQRFRPEFRPAFQAWIASRPLRSPNAAPSPFSLPEYRLAEETLAKQLAHAADEESAASQHANRANDGYVFDAIILATVMFFGSTAQHSAVTRMRLVLLGVALMTCVVGIYRLVTAPLAWPS